MGGVLRQASGLRSLIIVLVLTALLVGIGLIKIRGNVVFRDPFDLFGQFMMSPLALLLPALASLIGSPAVYRELRWRYAAMTRTRMTVSSYVVRQLMANALSVFSAFFASTLLVGIFAFYIWPPLHPELFDLSVYRLDDETVKVDVLSRASLSQFMQWGPLVYLAVYSMVLGVGAAALVSIGNVLMLLASPLWLGIVVPFAIFIFQSVLAGISGMPYLGLLFALFPFGLDQQPLLLSISPVIAFVLVALVLSVIAARRSPVLESLR